MKFFLSISLCVLYVSLSVSSAPVDSDKCSDVRNPNPLCAYWGADSLGGLAQKAVAFRSQQWGLHGAWGLPDGTDYNSCGDIDSFTNFYCSQITENGTQWPGAIDPSTAVINFTDCLPDPLHPYKLQHVRHPHHECKCHAAKYNLGRNDWIKYMNDCTFKFSSKFFYFIHCRFDKYQQCNYIQDFADFPYSNSTCRPGFRFCNHPTFQQNQYDEHVVPVHVNEHCTALCRQPEVDVHSPFFDITDPKPSGDDATTNSPDSSTKSGDDVADKLKKAGDDIVSNPVLWIIIGVVLLVLVLLIIMFIMLCVLCTNGKFRGAKGLKKTTSEPSTIIYKSLRTKRTLLGLRIQADTQRNFVAPIVNKKHLFIIGGCNCSMNDVVAVVTDIGKTLKVHVDDKLPYLSWKLNKPGKLSFARCFGNRQKVILPVTNSKVRALVGNIVALKSIQIVLLDEDYNICDNLPLFTPSSLAGVKMHDGKNKDESIDDFYSRTLQVFGKVHTY